MQMFSLFYFTNGDTGVSLYLKQLSVANNNAEDLIKGMGFDQGFLLRVSFFLSDVYIHILLLLSKICFELIYFYNHLFNYILSFLLNDCLDRFSYFTAANRKIDTSNAKMA